MLKPTWASEICFIDITNFGQKKNCTHVDIKLKYTQWV